MVAWSLESLDVAVIRVQDRCLAGYADALGRRGLHGAVRSKPPHRRAAHRL